jgi:hypothetical protein
MPTHHPCLNGEVPQTPIENVDPHVPEAPSRPAPAQRRFRPEPAIHPWADLQDLPWWAGALLTIADLLHRPWISVSVWGFVIGRGVLRALRQRSALTGVRDGF